jgi:hypothetical protein
MQAWAGFAGAAAVVFAALKGTASFEEWLRQRQMERRLDAGDKTLRAIYQIKDAFVAIRNPMLPSGELGLAESKLRESLKGFDALTSDEQSRYRIGQVGLERILRYGGLWQDLSDCLPLARTCFGSELDEKLRDILKARYRVFTSAQLYSKIDRTQSAALVENIEATIWWVDGQDEPNPIALQLESAISFAEAGILPFLSAQYLREKKQTN